MAIHFSTGDINNIIKLYTIDMLGMKAIGKGFGIGEKPIKRVLIANGVNISFRGATKFTKDEVNSIFEAYASGVGVGGIPFKLGLSCSENPVKALIKSKYGSIRNRSQQQQARMDNMTIAEKRAITKSANIAATGSIRKESSNILRARTLEGAINSLSSYEPVIYDFLTGVGFNAIPSKAIHIYNADFAIDSVTVEVFGGGWSISDKSRLDRYISRTKKIGNLGYHTVFIILTNRYFLGDGSELISAINELRGLPTRPSQYRVIGGNTKFSSGLCDDINHDSFISPFVKSRDIATGRYFRS